MNILKLMTFIMALLATSVSGAMQQQRVRQAPQQHTARIQRQSQEQSTTAISPTTETIESDVAVLEADAHEVMTDHTVTTDVQSVREVTNTMVTVPGKKPHERICPGKCGGLAINCPHEQLRIEQGYPILCGCSLCGEKLDTMQALPRDIQQTIQSLDEKHRQRMINIDRVATIVATIWTAFIVTVLFSLRS